MATTSRAKTLKARRKAAAKKTRRPAGPTKPKAAPKTPAACRPVKRTKAPRTAKQRAAARKAEAARKKACAKAKAKAKKKASPKAPASGSTGTFAPAVPVPPAPAAAPAAPAAPVVALPPPPVLAVPPVPPVTTPPAAPPPPSAHPDPAGPLTLAGAQRLLWRAGFGPRPGEAQALVDKGLDAAVRDLVSPTGAPTLTGPAPVDEDGVAIAPRDLWGHDHLWWLDRMVRTDQPLVERMTLIWHDWFATSREKVDVGLMLDQNAVMRGHALGRFPDLLRDVTRDPAMLVWLDGIDNNRWHPNENHAREIMELFTLGANRGAYTETDVREAARAMTGWRASWLDSVGFANFRFDAGHHDAGSKTVFGRSGAWGWADVCRLCVEHPLHPSFFVTKLWSAFVPVAPSAATVTYLQAVYVGSGYRIAPVVEAILRHRVFHEGPGMVVPPVVQQAGMLRTLGRGVDYGHWGWYGSRAGQQLFMPPNVSGWDEAAWLDTSSWKGRWEMASIALYPRRVDPWGTPAYSATETPAAALTAALAFCGDPVLSPEVRAELAAFAVEIVPAGLPTWEQSPRRAMRQNALRLLILTSSDVMAP